ncbi:hypothetical protein PoB_001901000 [Plakobranchus ocellatus]|uniref:Uncharacterized protein n=1 Tax=Plakobranchus ocellatus TaxID=259542 RepID=A0AAV3ZBI4_9GAST|nr:hypothetical protein PoB_001901000 [Plakobranchus ocellatus]
MLKSVTLSFKELKVVSVIYIRKETFKGFAKISLDPKSADRPATVQATRALDNPEAGTMATRLGQACQMCENAGIVLPSCALTNQSGDGHVCTRIKGEELDNA